VKQTTQDRPRHEIRVLHLTSRLHGNPRSQEIHVHQRLSTPNDPDLRPDGAGCFVAGTGTPIVMLHSSLSSKAQWTALAKRLASRFRVIALDLCGYGDNALPSAETSFTLDDEVRLVAAHVDRLVETRVRVHFVGHSYGGLVALRFAQGRPERVASLSLYEPVVFRVLNDDDTALLDIARLAEHVRRLVAAGRRHDAAQSFVDFWSGEGSYVSLPMPTQAGVARRIDKVPLDFQAAFRWPLAPADLRAIVAPTLLLAGNRSPAFMPRLVASLSQALPDRRVRWLDCGHMGPVTDAHRVNPWIEAFLDTCADADAPRAPFRPVAATAWASRWRAEIDRCAGIGAGPAA
jgi:pimeloyl-ACP methyl ester carboxylesterase